MDASPSLFQTKVARRVASLFLVCAGLPLAALAALTIWRTTGELSRGATERLRYEATTLQQEAENRLHRMAEGLQSLTRAMELDDSASLGRDVRLRDYLTTMPSAAVVRLSDGKVVRLAGNLPVPRLSQSHQRHLTARGQLLTSDGQRLVLVVRGMRPNALAATVVDERWVLGLDDPSRLPPDSAVCVATGVNAPKCSIVVAPDVLTSFAGRPRDTEATIPAASGPQTAWISALNLGPSYNASPWTFALMRPQSVIRQPIGRFIQDLLIVVLITGLIVAWVSARQVQHQLRPLAALTAATAKLRQHELNHQVDIQSDDEFGQLGDAFNEMAAELRQRFADLEAFNIGTLTTLARAIDAKSPWTAGHSERVASISALIATALGLPDDEIDLIRKGSLVHDVGKIATPIEILDKPTQLTPDEERIMRLHPEKGMHILEPIPAFAPLLPVIGQHHERWDGTGYPAHRAGETIDRGARIVAVADVYDALRSSRPYRSGLPHVRVVNVIRSGAGTQFDPAVVAAFLEIEVALSQTALNADVLTPAVSA